MNVSSINSFKAIQFSSKKSKKGDEFENPINRKSERNLAILGSVGGSAVTGAIVGGLSTFLFPMKEGVKRTLGNSHWPVAIGIGTMAIISAFSLPSKLYNTKVNAFVKEKEMDVFSRDRDLKSNLTEEVGKEVKDEDVSLDKKLDDNLKLQMANKGTALGIANITSQAQG